MRQVNHGHTSEKKRLAVPNYHVPFRFEMQGERLTILTATGKRYVEDSGGFDLRELVETSDRMRNAEEFINWLRDRVEA